MIGRVGASPPSRSTGQNFPYVIYKPWPRGVYVRYTPAVRNLFVIFPEGQRPEGYTCITNKLPNIAGVYLKIYTDWT